MSKSRNFKRYDFDIEENYVSTRKEVKKKFDRRKEKRLTSALKSKDIKLLYELDHGDHE